MATLASFKFVDEAAKAAAAKAGKGLKLPNSVVDGTWKVVGVKECTSQAGKVYYKLNIEFGAVKEDDVYISQYTLYTLVTPDDKVKDAAHLGFDIPDNFSVAIKGGYYSKGSATAPTLTKEQRFKAAFTQYASVPDATLAAMPEWATFA